MSRVGKRILAIPADVKVEINGPVVVITGPKGTLTKTFTNKVIIEQIDQTLTVRPVNDEKTTIMLHGTTNSLLSGMIEGVTNGFNKELEINGVGYNVKKNLNNLEFTLGFSHKINLLIPEHLSVELISPTALKVSGIDKQQVGEFAAKIKKLKKPEPYGGKGIKYKGEVIKLKAGKKTQK